MSWGLSQSLHYSAESCALLKQSLGNNAKTQERRNISLQETQKRHRQSKNNNEHNKLLTSYPYLVKALIEVVLTTNSAFFSCGYFTLSWEKQLRGEENITKTFLVGVNAVAQYGLVL